MKNNNSFVQKVANFGTSYAAGYLLGYGITKMAMNAKKGNDETNRTPDAPQHSVPKDVAVAAVRDSLRRVKKYK
jgi:hypothetical protein